MTFLTSIMQRTKINIQRWHFSRKKTKFLQDLSFTKATQEFPDRNNLHSYMHHYHQHLCPKLIMDHRKYYSQNKRGFGEDALHAMWWTLMGEFRPKKVLEIGVYRGQVTSLWGLIAKLKNFTCEVSGISPFSSAGDKVSVYLSELDYLQDTLESNQYFDLPRPFFLQEYSTDAKAVKYIQSTKWDLIYIDGNHDYDIALSDYKICSQALARDGLLIMDDSSLYTDFSPPAFSFAGHPGPSRVAQEHAMKELCFLGGVGHNNVFINK